MMLTDVVNTFGSLMWEAGDAKSVLLPTDQKVSLVGRVLRSLKSKRCAKIENTRSFSPMRFLWWASLLYVTQAQRTETASPKSLVTSLDGTNGFVVFGENGGDASGYSVSCAGDVNDDGVDDLLIGAHYADRPSNYHEGWTYVIFGQKGQGFTKRFDLGSLNGTNGFVIYGGQRGGRFGHSVSTAGDVNNDGIGDILIGADELSPMNRTDAGKSYVIFGNREIGKGGLFKVTNLNGQNGFAIIGEGKNEKSGSSVASAGDFNDDGIDDIMIGAPGISRRGIVFVVFGSQTIAVNGLFDLALLDGMNGFKINGRTKDVSFGNAVTGVGDVNGDGVSDILIGASDATVNGIDGVGKAYVLFGKKNIGLGGEFYVRDIQDQGLILEGDQRGDLTGWSVSGAGDVNNDGYSDVLVGSPESTALGMAKAGKTYVVFGGPNVGSPNPINLESLDGSDGFIIMGENANDLSGWSVSKAGDINGDGIDDLLIGATGVNSTSGILVGRSYIIFGRQGLWNNKTFELSNINATSGITIFGEDKYDSFGYRVSTAGDLNGDNITDIVIGNPNAEPNGINRLGKTYVIFGHALRPSKTTSIIQTMPPSLFQRGSTTPSSGQSMVNIQASSSSQASLSTNPLPITSIPFSRTSFSTQNAQTKIPSNKPSTPFLMTYSESRNDPVPLYIGIAAGATALACSLLAGGLFFYKQKNKRGVQASPSQEEDQQPLSDYGAISNIQREMQSARVESGPTTTNTDNEYTAINVIQSPGHYKQLSNTPAPSTPDQYTSIDQVEKQHDEYMAAKFKKAHENYDDVNLEGGL